MKRLIILFMLFIPVVSVAQDKKDKKEEDVTITINVTKASKTLGKIVSFFKEEAKTFKEETQENMSPENKAAIKKIKNDFLYEMKYTRDAIHAGYRQALRGEEYQPPYKHK